MLPKNFLVFSVFDILNAANQTKVIFLMIISLESQEKCPMEKGDNLLHYKNKNKILSIINGRN